VMASAFAATFALIVLIQATALVGATGCTNAPRIFACVTSLPTMSGHGTPLSTTVTTTSPTQMATQTMAEIANHMTPTTITTSTRPPSSPSYMSAAFPTMTTSFSGHGLFSSSRKSCLLERNRYCGFLGPPRPNEL
jgi:ABC-type transport system substrate-binding protein